MHYLLTKFWRKGTRSNQILVAWCITTTHMTAILKNTLYFPGLSHWSFWATSPCSPHNNIFVKNLSSDPHIFLCMEHLPWVCRQKIEHIYNWKSFDHCWQSNSDHVLHHSVWGREYSVQWQLHSKLQICKQYRICHLNMESGWDRCEKNGSGWFNSKALLHVWQTWDGYYWW